MRLLLPAALFFGCVLLASASVYELSAPLEAEATDAATEPLSVPPLPKIAPFVAPPAALYSDVDARPLFAADRKPLPDDGLDTKPTANVSDFSVVGILTGGARAIALLRSRDGATTSVAVGDLLGGWRVTVIAPTSITLKSNGSESVLGLSAPSNAPPSQPLPAISAEPAETAPSAAAPPASATAPATGAPSPAAASPVAGKPSAPPRARPPILGNAQHPAPHKIDPTISPDAGGFTYDPQTGEPTL